MADTSTQPGIAPGELSKTYNATLRFRDLDSGKVASVFLPFGLPAVESDNPVWRDLHARVKKVDGELGC